ncbi:Equilibrative nucleoside transporter, partial [Globisporangium splendens]
MRHKAHVVYAIFFLVGIGASLPWNVFITAQQYFQERLVDTDYEESFLNWFSMAFNISTLLSMVIRTLCFAEKMPSAVTTVFFSLVVTTCIIFGHCWLTRMPEYNGRDGYAWHVVFFQATMISILVVACATTMMQDGMLRIISKFPPQFTQAVVAGQAMAGLAVSTSSFFITMASPSGPHLLQVLAQNSDLCAFIYFVLVFATLIVCTLAFAVLAHMEIFRHYQSVDHPIGDYLDEKVHNGYDVEDSARETLLSEDEQSAHDDPLPGTNKVDLFDLTYRIRYYAAANFFVFIVTLGVFPSITSAIQSVNPASGRFFRDLFTPFTLILFNFGDLLGRLVATSWHSTNPLRVMLASLARTAFFPLLMLCNLQNEHHQVITYVLIKSDLASMGLLLACAVTNGLITTLSLMHYPRLLRTNKEKELGGTVMFFILSIGLTAGSLMSFVLRAMLKHKRNTIGASQQKAVRRAMASKLEYLQRYMSSSASAGAADAGGEKKLRKKKKKEATASASGSSSSASRFRVIDADHEWEQDAPSKDAIEQKWEQDAADEERPVVVADGEIVDPTDLPVYVNAEEYLDELNARQRGAARDDDLSPPRKSKQSEGLQAKKSNDKGKPRDRKYSSDGSPPRKDAAGNGRRQKDRNDHEDDASPPRRRRNQAPSRRKADSDSENDASPPRRSQPARRSRQGDDDSDDDASPPRRKPTSRQSEERSSGKRRSAADVAARDSNASPVRRPAAAACKSPPKVSQHDDDASSPRRYRSDPSDGDASPPRRRPVKSEKPEEQRKEPAQPPQPRRTDSLGRDIPDIKKETSRKHRENDDSDASPPRERGESSRNRSRSPSTRGRGRSRSHSRHRSSGASRARGGSRRSRSRSRSTSPRRRRRRSPSRSRSNGRRHRSESRSRSRARRSSGHRSVTRQSRRASRSRSGSVERRRYRHSRSPARSGRQAFRQERVRSLEQDSPPRKHQKREDVKDDTPRAASSKSEATANKQADKVKDHERKDDAEPQKARAGLFTAKEFAEEHKRKLRQNDFLRTADASDMGANAETVYRDKRGRKLDMLNEMVRQQEILDGKREREAREEYEWGTGKVQKQELKNQRELMEQIKQAPFARHEDDPELEQLRKERVRAFDPMNSKVFQEDDLFGGGKSSKKSKSKKKSGTKPKYAGPPAPPNRFGIQPGYRWDGVVRGTGWEEKLLLRQNKQSAASEEAYRYAVADM